MTKKEEKKEKKKEKKKIKKILSEESAIIQLDEPREIKYLKVEYVKGQIVIVPLGRMTG